MATITGDAGPDSLRGTEQDDTIRGLGGNDVLDGLGGDDVLDGGTGLDTADYSGLASLGDRAYGVSASLSTGLASGGYGTDTLVSIEGLVGTQFDDQLTGGGRAEDLVGGLGDDTLRGLGGADDLQGGPGADFLYGDDLGDRGGGGDRLVGGGGTDYLGGFAGDDRLSGGGGVDYLEGGTGDDVLAGGAGQDEFYQTYYDSLPSSAGGSDVITDFEAARDHLHVDIVGPSSRVRGFAGLDSNGDGVLDGDDRYVRVENVSVDGTSKLSTVIDTAAVAGNGGEQSLTVYGVTGLTSASFAGTGGAAAREAESHHHEIA